MPFDGSGNFSRVHDWTDDRDAGIKIQATRFDQENDDFASAFNLVMLRTGVAAMTGDLDMGQQSITDIGNGTAAAPSIQFNTDPNTGIYLAATGRLGFAANGTERFHVDTAGASVTGTFEVSGALTVAGNSVLTTASTIDADTLGGNAASAFALLSGAAFAGTISAPTINEGANRVLTLAGGTVTGTIRLHTASNQILLKNSSGTTRTAIQRVDANDFYILLTEPSASPSDSFNSLRPFSIQLSTGGITSQNGQTFSGGTNISSGNFTVATGRIGVGVGTSPAYPVDVSSTEDVVAAFKSTDPGAYIFIGDSDTSANNVLVGGVANQFVVRIAGGNRLVVNTTGARINDKQMFHNSATSFTSAAVTFSPSAPSGGSDGDIWFQY